MKYIVSGFPRSGTSMMMACLEAGGMKCHKSDKRELLRQSRTDEFYNPNRCGLYEPTMEELKSLNFGNTVVKVVTPWLRLIDSVELTILMLRDPEEIRQSLEAFTGERLAPEWVYKYNDLIDAAKFRLREIGSSVLELAYRDVLAEPLAAMQMLVNSGWPINPLFALKIIDHKQCRFRRELLVAGL